MSSTKHKLKEFFFDTTPPLYHFCRFFFHPFSGPSNIFGITYEFSALNGRTSEKQEGPYEYYGRILKTNNNIKSNTRTKDRVAHATENSAHRKIYEVSPFTDCGIGPRFSETASDAR